MMVAKANAVETERARSSWAWFGFKLVSLAVLFVLAGVGVLALVLLNEHKSVLPDIPAVRNISALVDLYGPPAIAVLKFLIQSGGFAVFAVALLLAVLKIDKVAKVISDFIQARGDIHSLVTSVENVPKHAEKLAEHAAKMSDLRPLIQETAEKIEDALKQIGDLQRIAVSQRTDAEPSLEAARDGGPKSANLPSVEVDRNWEELRALWNINGMRLDDVISRIQDKRRRDKFKRMPRTNYPAIIDALGDAKFISEAARKHSQELHSTFMSFKPRNRAIPDDIVERLRVYDQMLEHELSGTTTTASALPSSSASQAVSVNKEPEPVS